jgi:hypothetical protein
MMLHIFTPLTEAGKLKYHSHQRACQPLSIIPAAEACRATATASPSSLDDPAVDPSSVTVRPMELHVHDSRFCLATRWSGPSTLQYITRYGSGESNLYTPAC